MTLSLTPTEILAGLGVLLVLVLDELGKLENPQQKWERLGNIGEPRLACRVGGLTGRTFG